MVMNSVGGLQRQVKSMSKKSNSQAGVVSSQQKSKGIFGLSEAAALRITQLLGERTCWQLFSCGCPWGGCSGFQYDFSIDKNRGDDDLVFFAYDVEVVVDEMSLELIDHAELDYVQDLMGSYFAVKNPNATVSCGCGTSFSI